MRHRIAQRKLGRTTPHRIALLRNLATALFERERIQTTLAKAKELRPFAERLITVSRREGDRLHARRLVLRDIKDATVVRKLFDTIGARLHGPPGRLHANREARRPSQRWRRDGDHRAGRVRGQSRGGRGQGQVIEEAGSPEGLRREGGEEAEGPQKDARQEGERQPKARQELEAGPVRAPGPPGWLATEARSPRSDPLLLGGVWARWPAAPDVHERSALPRATAQILGELPGTATIGIPGLWSQLFSVSPWLLSCGPIGAATAGPSRVRLVPRPLRRRTRSRRSRTTVRPSRGRRTTTARPRAPRSERPPGLERRVPRSCQPA